MYRLPIVTLAAGIAVAVPEAVHSRRRLRPCAERDRLPAHRASLSRPDHPGSVRGLACD